MYSDSEAEKYGFIKSHLNLMHCLKRWIGLIRILQPLILRGEHSKFLCHIILRKILSLPFLPENNSELNSEIRGEILYIIS